MNALPATIEPMALPATQEAHGVRSLQEKSDWFVEIGNAIGELCYYTKEDLASGLRDAILRGQHGRDSAVKIHTKGADGTWTSKDSGLLELAAGHFSLRTLYEPVWSHAMAGLKVGALVGIAVKLLDTSAMLASVDPTLAILFLASIGACLIPRVGFMGVMAVSLVSMKVTKLNFFIMGMSAAAVGAALGCLPGMAIGGILGFARRRSLPLAKDAAPELPSLLVKAVLLPAVAGIALLASFVFVLNPWLLASLE